MSLQNGLPNRRKFLERSMLGFGGTFLLPSLLTSCTDHDIPAPDPGTGLTEDELGINWNDDVRASVIFGIGKIPDGGEIVSRLLDALWPTNGKPFDQMKASVEALIDQKLNEDTYNHVNDVILGGLSPARGLAGLMAEYTSAVTFLANDPTKAATSKSSVVSQFQITRSFFVDHLADFQAKTYEVLLLPLFAQYANMYLTLLRDGALHGKDWDMSQGIINDVLTDLVNLPGQFAGYVGDYSKGIYASGVKSALAFAKDDSKHPDDWKNLHYVEPFWTTNAYSRQTTFDVLDFAGTWQYYDVSKYPNGKTGADGKAIKASELLPIEIYSDPRGTTITNQVVGPSNIPIPLPSPLVGWPSSFPTQIEVWAGDRIDALRVTYPPGGGPAGITQTARMGGPGGDTTVDGGVLDNALSNPITQFKVGTLNVAFKPGVPILSFLQFSRYSQNPPLKKYGGKDSIPIDDWGWVGYPGRAVSSIYVGGSVPVQGNKPASCIVVGFKHWDSPALALRAVRIHYVTSPIEKTMADLVKAFPDVAIPAGLIEAAKAARLAHWARIETAAKK